MNVTMHSEPNRLRHGREAPKYEGKMKLYTGQKEYRVHVLNE